MTPTEALLIIDLCYSPYPWAPTDSQMVALQEYLAPLDYELMRRVADLATKRCANPPVKADLEKARRDITQEGQPNAPGGGQGAKVDGYTLWRQQRLANLDLVTYWQYLYDQHRGDAAAWDKEWQQEYAQGVAP
jgi:hypothetical protein